MTGDEIRVLCDMASLITNLLDRALRAEIELERMVNRKCSHDGGLPPYDRVRGDLHRAEAERDAALAKIAAIEAVLK